MNGSTKHSEISVRFTYKVYVHFFLLLDTRREKSARKTGVSRVKRREILHATILYPFATPVCFSFPFLDPCLLKQS